MFKKFKTFLALALTLTALSGSGLAVVSLRKKREDD